MLARGQPEGQERTCPQVNFHGVGHGHLSPGPILLPPLVRGPVCIPFQLLCKHPTAQGALSTPKCSRELDSNPMLSWVVQNPEGDARRHALGVSGKEACSLLKETHRRRDLSRAAGKVAGGCRSPQRGTLAPESDRRCERTDRNSKNRQSLLHGCPDSRCHRPRRLPPERALPGASCQGCLASVRSRCQETLSSLLWMSGCFSYVHKYKGN